MTLSIDSETTGLDFHHGAKPYYITTCQDGLLRDWEWDVDPLTREPQINQQDLREIGNLLGACDHFVFQNGKFDLAALRTVGLWDLCPGLLQHVFAHMDDTLLAAHLLESNRPKDLTSLAIRYLGKDIEPLELSIARLTAACRRRVQQAKLKVKRGGEESALASWQIACQGHPNMPSAGPKTWKYDMWLPRAMALWEWSRSEARAQCDNGQDLFRAQCDNGQGPFSGLGPEGLPGWEFRPSGGHPYWTALADYADGDSSVALLLWPLMEEEIGRRRLWKIYQERRKLIPIAYGMELRGVTLSGQRLKELKSIYAEESGRAAAVCKNIALEYNYELELPDGGVNNSLRTFMCDTLQLEPVYNSKSKTDAPTLNKAAMEYYLSVLPGRSKPLFFVRTLLGKRSRDVAVNFMSAYERFWVPLPGTSGWCCLHPSLNPTGAGTLRWSSSNPNEQNISSKENFNLRYCFGPAPGREWWSLDYKNIERRIPAYEAGEEEIIALFESPDEPPYFGSEHLLVAHIQFPSEFEACTDGRGNLDGRIFKKRYASTLYRRTKNFDFAVQYMAVDKEDGTGTADRTIGIPGAQAKVAARFSKQAALNKWCVQFAEKHGYIETIPDRTVDPERGYPLLCTRTEYGRIKPTVPFNYRVQGSACWLMARAMVRVQAQLDDWNKGASQYWIALQIHDELVLDMPRRGHPITNAGASNLARVRVVQRLMEQRGQDLVVPVKSPVGIEYHDVCWSKGVALRT